MATKASSAHSNCRTLLAATLLTTAALTAQQVKAQANPGQSTGGAAEPSAEGLPSFLLKVPGGQVSIGLTTEEWLQLVRESINPNRPELSERETNKFTLGLKLTASELGEEKRAVDTFLLGKSPVTNGEYEKFLQHMQKQGLKVRPPFHWWRYGRKDDYEKRIADINKLFPKDGKFAALYYWERFGPELPYALVDDKGNSIADHPVVFVDRKDAVRYAGMFGMRLPTEEERTRAVRGDSNSVYPWGGNKDLGDKYGEKLLELMQLSRPGDKHTKAVGSVAFLNGPFGHTDMFGNVWELTTVRTFAPICGQKPFEGEWRRAQKDKLGSLLSSVPQWKDGGVIVKGSSYLSWSEPLQFHIDSRVSISTDDVLESVGFRLAKSLKPGYDLLHSLAHSDYAKDLFQQDQDVDMENQVGVERYLLDQAGGVTDYYAVSFAPVNWLAPDKSTTLQKLEEKSQQAPLLIGTLACTEAMAEPKLTGGIYSVAFRKAGVPKELKDKWSEGLKEVRRKQKLAGKGGDEPADEPAKEGGKDKDPGKEKSDWRSVLTRFGLTEKDLEDKDADAKGPTFIRIGDTKVAVEEDLFLFFNNESKCAGTMKATPLTAGNLGACEVAMTQRKVEKQDHLAVEFKIHGVLLKDQKKGVEYKLDITLDQAPLAPGETWRLPIAK